MRAWLVIGAALVAANGCKQDNPAFCSDDKPCSVGQCNDVTNECEIDPADASPQGPDATSCSDDQECIETTQPICSNLGQCRECTGAPECALKDPALGQCAASGQCVECTASSQCGDAFEPICRDLACDACNSDAICEERDPATVRCADDGRCVECADHNQCTSGVCDRAGGVCVAAAGVVYVSESGVDTPGCGEAGAPCRLVSAALLRVEAGRRHVLVAPGSYEQDIVIDQDVSIVGPGATVEPTSSDTPSISVTNAATVIVDGLIIERATGNGQADGVGCQSASASVRLERVTVRMNAAAGVDVRNGCDTSIVQSTIAGNAGIGVSAAESSLQIRRSTVKRNLGGGVQVVDAPFTLVNNFVLSNGDPGMMTGTQFGGVRLENMANVSPQVFDHNTVANSRSSSSGLASGVYCFTSAPAVLSSNIVFDGFGASAVGGNCGYAFSDVQGGVAGDTNINAPPMFLEPGMDDYHLESSSPAKSAADPTSGVVVDIDGDPRPLGANPDIGADEIFE